VPKKGCDRAETADRDSRGVDLVPSNRIPRGCEGSDSSRLGAVTCETERRKLGQQPSGNSRPCAGTRHSAHFLGRGQCDARLCHRPRSGDGWDQFLKTIQKNAVKKLGTFEP
jgi:hypothetical protein